MIPLLVVVILLCLLAGPVAILLASQARRDARELRARLAEMERSLEARGAASEGRAPERQPGPAATAPPTPAVAAAGAPPASGAKPAPALPRMPGPGDWETLIGGQWLTWIGVLAIFFGTAFFLAYDLGESVFAGAGQVYTGLLVGALFILAGSALSRRPAQRFLGRGLLGGGVALLFLTAYASYGFHHLVPAAVVYPFLLGVALVGASVALREDSVMVATLTLAGALLTPPLLPAVDPTRALLPYLVAVNLGAVVVASRRRWPVLVLGGWLGSAILVASWWAGPEAPGHRPAALAGVGALWALYTAVPLLSPPRRGFWSVARGVVTVANGLAFAAFLYRLMDPGYEAFRGLATACLALAYVLASRGASARHGPTPGARLTHDTGLALAVLAVPMQFDLAWVTLGWALLGLVLLGAGFRLPSPVHRGFGLGVLGLAVFRVLTFDTVEPLQRVHPGPAVANGEFLAGLVVVAAVGLAAWLYRRRRDEVTRLERGLATPLVLLAAGLLWWRISSEVLVYFQIRESADRFSRELPELLTLSLAWALYAAALIGTGFATRFRPLRLLGVAILGLLILKVFFFDMQALERGYRIASFVAVGILLLAVSLLYQRERRA